MKFLTFKIVMPMWLFLIIMLPALTVLTLWVIKVAGG